MHTNAEWLTLYKHSATYECVLIRPDGTGKLYRFVKIIPISYFNLSRFVFPEYMYFHFLERTLNSYEMY